MKEFGHSSQVACKVALRSFGYTFSTPANEHVLGKTGVGVRHLHKCELHPSFGEFLNKIGQFTVLITSSSIEYHLGWVLITNLLTPGP